MVGALDVLTIVGRVEALPILRAKFKAWRDIDSKTTHPPNPNRPRLYYSALEVKAKRAISAIETRSK
jgi:hypothetical protein